MKYLRLIIAFSLICIFTDPIAIGSKPVSKMSRKTYTYLALGDSYTIGESVPAKENFPNQTVQLLRNAGLDLQSPEIIAKTGWTTDELQEAINKHKFQRSYDFVTLLIGVNNQYRGKSVDEYKPGFESLLKQAIKFAGDKSEHVIVLSIPDWGVTPYAEGRDRKKIAEEINAYNAANKAITENYKVNYIDITPDTRKATNDLSLLTDDRLHPSGKEYAIWAAKLAAIIQNELK